MSAHSLLSNGAEQMRTMSSRQLHNLYDDAPPGPVPDGDSIGTPVFLPGTLIGATVSYLGGLAWKGKVFTRVTDSSATLVNKILGLRFGKAKVYPGESWNDSHPSVIIEYWGSSLLFFWIRDEIRQVFDGDEQSIYLGRAYLRLLPGVHVFGTWFILSFPKTPPSA
jgi:hypothetical protein